MKRVCVTGAGGFIGHHLVTFLKQEGYWVRGVDLKYPEYTEVDADEFELLDLRRWDSALQATRGVDQVYALAADMGGMGYISTHHAEILTTTRSSTCTRSTPHGSTACSATCTAPRPASIRSTDRPRPTWCR